MGCGASQNTILVQEPAAEQQDVKATRAQASGLSFMWRGPTAAAVDVRRLEVHKVQTEMQVINRFQSVLPGR